MLYREMGKTGDKVSVLGYGCMRFPRKDRRIDEERAERQVLSAIERGVNYFDTAYIYPNSEAVLGNILAKGQRDKVMIATKMPPIMIHSQKDMENTLQTSLKRLQTDHIDYYLMHAVSGMEGWQRLKQLGIEEFLEKTKKSGKINRIGFSYHGDQRQFKAIIDDYPWDFCQIQYNYLDEHTQAGKAGLEYAASKGVGVSIMEPLRGGLLARRMPDQVQALWDEAEIKRTPVEWALKWVWDHPEVSTVLSGMNEEAQLDENIAIANTAYPKTLRAEELAIIDQAKELLAGMLKVGCTGCGYCMPCPAGVNIPMCFGYYNNKNMFPKSTAKAEYFGMTMGIDGGKPAFASLCKYCGKCERHCPQNLPVQQLLKQVSKEMEGFYFKPVVGLVRNYYKVRKLMGREKI